MATRTPKPKKDQRAPWVPLPDAAYDAITPGLIHFSAKMVNSNTSPFGVLLGESDKSELPYVAVTTVGPGRVPFDFSGNAGAAKAAAQLLAVNEGRVHEKYKDAPEGEIAAINLRIAGLKPMHTNSNDVGIRLRQVLFPVGESYVALTPLHSSGFSVVLESLLEKERDEAQAANKKRPYRKLAVLGFGGSNPHNVGLRVRAMQKALVFDVPQEDANIKAAYAIHHKGVSLAPPKEVMEEYLVWRDRLIRTSEHRGNREATEVGVTSTLATRASERQYLEKMVSAVGRRLEKAKQSLNQVPDFNGELALHLPAVQHALFAAEANYPDFIHDCAAGLLQSLEAYSGKTKRTLSSSAVNRLMPEVEALFMEILA